MLRLDGNLKRAGSSLDQSGKSRFDVAQVPPGTSSRRPSGKLASRRPRGSRVVAAGLPDCHCEQEFAF
jgi:hypothetical protein